MTEYKDASGRLSIELSSVDSGRLFEKFANDIVEGFRAELLQKLDGLDERYWDFNVDGTVIVLHSEAMMGISIHVQNGTQDDLLRKIATHLINVAK